MRIVVIISLYPPVGVGGAEKAASLLAEAMARNGDEVAVISLHKDNRETVEERNGVRVYRLPLDNFYWPFDQERKRGFLARALWHIRDSWNLQAAARVGRILDQERPDVVHSHNLAGFSVAVWKEVKKRGIRLVHTMHDYYLLCLRSATFRNGQVCAGRCLECKAARTQSKKWSSKLDEVISVSRYVLDTHKRNGYFEGVSSSVIYNINEAKTCASPALDRDPSVLSFGFIGQVKEEKGIAVLLEATRRLTSANWRLKIAGAGREAYVAHLQEKYRDPRIIWLGYRNAADFYNAVDVVVVPSLWPDPLPYVVIEALSSLKTLICARSGGIPELATLGKLVRTYDPRDVDALAEAMNEALRDPITWRRGGFQAQAASENAFEQQQIVAKYHRRYVDA